MLPVDEVIQTHTTMMPYVDAMPKVGPVTWCWTDDNSNYCGILTDGPLSGWLTVFDHEEPMLTPAFRSIGSFMERVLVSVADDDGGEQMAQSPALDIPSIAREVPESIPHAGNFDTDKALAASFRRLYVNEQNNDLRRLYAFCSICLTPFENTAEVLPFLADNDMWTPEAAVRLLEVRRFPEGVPELEKLAREGGPNGDSAAMRQLVRVSTDQSRHAIARLKATLKGRKLQSLEMWVNRRFSLQEPQWP
jgi:hypothetical protein